jgi:hypothetical protein
VSAALEAEEPAQNHAERPAPWFAPVGVLIGTAGALCGIGGGIFAGPLLHAVKRVPLKRAAATAILVVLATTLAATTAELVRGDSALHAHIVAPLALGALLGAQLGFALSHRVNERQLKTIFALVLALAGVRVLFFTSSLAPPDALGGLAAGAIALAIGVAGGTLTPLLGVAGGVLMVPALFLFLGQPFGVARASALAAGAVSALRSGWLHARAGNVSARLGLPLAAGALVGALVGTSLAHHAALVHVGRVLLGSILLAQSARFVRELGPRRAESAHEPEEREPA